MSYGAQTVGPKKGDKITRSEQMPKLPAKKPLAKSVPRDAKQSAERIAAFEREKTWTMINHHALAIQVFQHQDNGMIVGSDNATILLMHLAALSVLVRKVMVLP